MISKINSSPVPVIFLKYGFMILFAYLFSAALFLQKDSLLTDTLRKDSIWKNVNLENITIKGSNIAHYPDKDVYTITDEMRKNTIDTYGILEKLPGMFVDKIDRSITYKGKQNIIVLVDGKKKDISYIGNLHNMRFKKIEVYENTHPRYLNADVVINVITKEQWQGFDFSDNTSAKDIEDWDSLEHITLISAVEREFKMKFKMGEISSMKNVGEMASIVAARGK